MSINFMLIGKRVKEIRISRKISQAELAERADLSASYISYIETAVKQASLTSLVQIANGLDVTVDNLLYGNQIKDSAEYHLELTQLLSDCNAYEKRIIFDMLLSLKNSLRDNWWLRRNCE